PLKHRKARTLGLSVPWQPTVALTHLVSSKPRTAKWWTAGLLTPLNTSPQMTNCTFRSHKQILSFMKTAHLLKNSSCHVNVLVTVNQSLPTHQTSTTWTCHHVKWCQRQPH